MIRNLSLTAFSAMLFLLVAGSAFAKGETIECRAIGKWQYRAMPQRVTAWGKGFTLIEAKNDVWRSCESRMPPGMGTCKIESCYRLHDDSAANFDAERK